MKMTKERLIRPNWWALLALTLTTVLLAACNFPLPLPQQPLREPLMHTPAPVLTRPETPDAQAPVEGDLLVNLPLAEQIDLVVAPVRDLADLRERLTPELGDISAVASTTAPDYQVGDQLDFWVHNIDTMDNLTVTAELVGKSDVAYAWVEADQPHNAGAIRRSLEQFSTRIYPAARAAFGSEWSPGVDGDPRVHILHTSSMGNGVAGYFSGADENNKLAFPFSNEKEMFYISLNWLNNMANYTTYETVLAHEFQHMIHWGNDRNEEVWLNEGLSEYAQEVAGYPADTVFASTFLAQPDTQLNSWNEATSNNAPHYGAAYLFVRYLVQQYGPEITRLLVAAPQNGIDGVNHVLQQMGVKQDFDALFADWVVANYADSTAVGQIDAHHYRELDVMMPTLADSLSAYPAAPIAATVQNFATDYIQLAGDGDLSIAFDGAETTQFAATEPPSGRLMWWSNRTDDSDTRLTRRFDLRNVDATTPLTMSATMWWDIEEGYDYGYVMASADGRSWQIMPGQRTTSENGSGNNLGAGYTGVSSTDGAGPGWVTETFDLSDYRDGDLWLRFEYVTDDAVNRPGWLIDDVAIPAIGYQADFESSAEGWQSEGWLLTDNQLAQLWLVQLLEFDGDTLVAVQRPRLDSNGRTAIDVDNLGGDRRAVLAISGLTPITSEPAHYRLDITPR
jgi:immune inhibitor A